MLPLTLRRGDGRGWLLAAVLVLLGCMGSVHAEDGYDLWLRYVPVDSSLAEQYRTRLGEMVAPDQTATQRAAREELMRGLGGLLGSAPRLQADGAGQRLLVLGTPDSSRWIAPFRRELDALGDEGYLLRQTRIDGRDVLLVAAPRDIGVLYGVFHLLRLLQTGASLDALEVRESPRMRLRNSIGPVSQMPGGTTRVPPPLAARVSMASE